MARKMIVSQYRVKPNVYEMPMGRWKTIAARYPLARRRQYFKQWKLESQILGYCAVYEEGNSHARACREAAGDCIYIRAEENWMMSELCGPRFIRKYIETEEDDDDAKSTETGSVQDHAQDDQGV